MCHYQGDGAAVFITLLCYCSLNRFLGSTLDVPWMISSHSLCAWCGWGCCHGAHWWHVQLGSSVCSWGSVCSVGKRVLCQGWPRFIFFPFSHPEYKKKYGEEHGSCQAGIAGFFTEVSRSMYVAGMRLVSSSTAACPRRGAPRMAWTASWALSMVPSYQKTRSSLVQPPGCLPLAHLPSGSYIHAYVSRSVREN